MNGIFRFLTYAALGVVSVVMLVLMSTVGLVLAVVFGIALFFNMRSLRARMRENTENGTFVVTTFRKFGEQTVETSRAPIDSESGFPSRSPDAGDPKVVDLDPSEYRKVQGSEDAPR